MLDLALRFKIMRHLGLHIGQQAEVEKALQSVTSPLLEAEIVMLLEEIDSISAQIADEQSSPNFALVKADVLEWEGGAARSKGMRQRKAELCNQLANFLNLPSPANRIAGTSSINFNIL